MTTPDDSTDDETTGGSAEAGALAAASEPSESGTDPLGPLNAVTEDDDS